MELNCITLDLRQFDNCLFSDSSITVLSFTVQDPGGIANVMLDSASSQYFKIDVSGDPKTKNCSIVSIRSLDREVFSFLLLTLSCGAKCIYGILFK